MQFKTKKDDGFVYWSCLKKNIVWDHVRHVRQIYETSTNISQDWFLLKTVFGTAFLLYIIDWTGNKIIDISFKSMIFQQNIVEQIIHINWSTNSSLKIKLVRTGSI